MKSSLAASHFFVVVGMMFFRSATAYEKVCVPVRDEAEDFYTLFRNQRSTGVSFVDKFSDIKVKPLRTTSRDVVIVRTSLDLFKLVRLGAHAEASLMMEIVTGKFDGILGYRNYETSSDSAAKVIVYFRKELEVQYVPPCGKDIVENGNFELLNFDENPIGSAYLTTKKRGVLFMMAVQVLSINGTKAVSFGGELEAGVSGLLSKMISGKIGGNGEYSRGSHYLTTEVSVEIFTIGNFTLRRPIPTNLDEIGEYIKNEFPFFENLTEGAEDLEYCMLDIRMLKECKIHAVKDFFTPVFRREHGVILKTLIDEVNSYVRVSQNSYARIQNLQNCFPQSFVRNLNDSFGIFNLFRAQIEYNMSRTLEQYLYGNFTEGDFLNLLNFTYFSLRSSLETFNNRYRETSIETTKYLSLFEALSLNSLQCWSHQMDLNVVRFLSCDSPFHLLFDRSNGSTLQFSETVKDFVDECQRCSKMCFLVNCEDSNVDCKYYQKLPVAVHYPNNVSDSGSVSGTSYVAVGACSFQSNSIDEICNGEEITKSRVLSEKFYFESTVAGKFCTRSSMVSANAVKNCYTRYLKAHS